MLKYLIIWPLVFLAGFIDAIAGGGGLISLPGYMIAGLPVHNAIATNKCSSCMGTSIATLKYGLKGFIPWKYAPLSILGAFIGSSLGANLALMVSDYYFRILMLIILPLTAVYVSRNKSFSEPKKSYGFLTTSLICMATSLCIGIYDGFYGPGTGTFLILLLSGIAHMDLSTSNGLTKCINLSTNIAALTVFLLNGKVLLFLGLTAGCFNIAGNYLGATYFSKGGAKSTRPVMIFVLVIFFIKVLYELIA